MAYSGTVGQTVISVQKLIDHGARRAGKLAEELTVEQVNAARESLYFLLSHTINMGINYWAIQKKVIGLNANKAAYLLPVGANDVLNALYRKLNRPDGIYSATSGLVDNAFDGNVDTSCVQTSPNGNIAIKYKSTQYIGSIGVLPAVSTSITVVFEYSTDGITWQTLYSPGQATWVDNEWLWYDITIGQNVLYYRMRAINGGTISVRELFFGNNSTEITMARLNRDDYTNLPNKNFTANQPFQFWLNKTIPQLEIELWPVPSDPFVQITIWYSRQIMDVGDLDGGLEIPQRWYMAVVNMLAHQMSMELPGIDAARIQYLEGQADKSFMLAEQEERDKSPIQLAPNIAVYNR
jgi:hypothetical protein